jgi:hypothetical protein
MGSARGAVTGINTAAASAMGDPQLAVPRGRLKVRSGCPASVGEGPSTPLHDAQRHDDLTDSHADYAPWLPTSRRCDAATALFGPFRWVANVTVLSARVLPRVTLSPLARNTRSV